MVADNGKQKIMAPLNTGKTSILEKIPGMYDNRLNALHYNAQAYILQGKRLDESRAVSLAVQEEWRKRTQGFHAGQYKADRPETGLLKSMRYTVGNQGETPKMRRQILDCVMAAAALPPVGSPAYMAEWGDPRSRARYWKLHRTIRSFASHNKHDGRMEKAVRDWEDDLVYLEEVWRPRAG